MKKSLTSLLILFALLSYSQDDTLVSFGSQWKFLDDGSNQGTAWRASSFDDSNWQSGVGEFGYGDGDENTVVSYGSDAANKYITTYFRHEFTITDITAYKSFLIRLIKDDGALVYVNGVNVMRSNFGVNSYNYLDEAYASISGSEETTIWEEFIPAANFQSGSNVIAVEVHQYSASSSDLSFDLELIGFDEAPELYREPYIQMTTPSSAIVKWKTSSPTTSEVKYGSSINSLNLTASSSAETMNHEVLISGLENSATYYYQVGNSSQSFTSPSAAYYFKTHPTKGVPKHTRIWVTGDAGTGKTGQYDVKDAYENYAGANGNADIWLMMGDNAYEHGREADYHMGLFEVYEDIMKHTVSFPTSGNHDFYGEASPTSQTGTYFDIFALPANGEAGGISSNTEAYYSFDYGDIHFVCLESYELDRDSTGAMATWLKNDLQATTARWLIAYWHYAPYTKVGHDSDDPNDHSGRAIEMRENIVPILEKYGVDLVLAGHSHGYERSYLLNGHYGYSGDLDNSMIMSSASGNGDINEAYEKENNLNANNGAVYVVCGSSGKLSSSTDTHPAMYTTNVDFMGSMIIDIVGDTLESKFLNENGIIQDYFHIVKPSEASTIKEIEPSPILNVFPNPSNNKVTISWKGIISGSISNFQVFNSLGQLVLEKNVSNNETTSQFSVINFEAGVYTIKLLNQEGIVESRMLVVK